MLNMQEAGATFACMRCELEGYKDLAIDRMRYGLYGSFLPSGHAQRPAGCKRPNQRTHNSILRYAAHAEEAGHPVKGVCGPSVFCLLPYFRIGGPGPVSWVLDARMHDSVVRFGNVVYFARLVLPGNNEIIHLARVDIFRTVGKTARSGELIVNVRNFFSRGYIRAGELLRMVTFAAVLEADRKSDCDRKVLYCSPEYL